MLVQAIERFVLGRAEVGEIQFLSGVDLCGVSLDPLIEIEKGRIQLYGLAGGPAAPAPGTHLNVPAILTFRCPSPSSLTTLVTCLSWP